MADIIEFQSLAAQRLPEQPRFPHPPNELERLATLLEYKVLDSLPEQQYDDLTAIAAHICDAPIALVSLLDGDRQWFKSHHGIDATETPREHAFCAHAIMQPENVMVVPNAAVDQRFQENPLVVSHPNIRFYAGTPLVNPEGMALGTLCVIDRVPREFPPEQAAALQALGRQVVAQLELRRQAQQLQQDKQDLKTALQQLRTTQTSLIQSEKMSALGELVAGVAHEFNNPLTFIQGNLDHCQDYTQELLALIELYQMSAPEKAIADRIAEIDLDYIQQDLPELFASMQNGVDRVQTIVQALRTFSHHDESGIKAANIHDDLDTICTLLDNRLQATELRPEITLVKQYGKLPGISCVPSQLNQVWMQLLGNAIDALGQGVGSAHPAGTAPQITLTTQSLSEQQIRVTIADNGHGISSERQTKIFEPFYTTKKVGVGIGMGLAISYKIVAKEHQGQLTFDSTVDWGTQMQVTLPVTTGSMVSAASASSTVGASVLTSTL
ncbi:MAG: GAF domain-containing sensor histidine kinase [Spirulina sp. SIO3F2]|nr:GAF domain-containing sensor histidine kinase [Spirulina sp. SIO3F2]